LSGQRKVGWKEKRVGGKELEEDRTKKCWIPKKGEPGTRQRTSRPRGATPIGGIRERDIKAKNTLWRRSK